MPAAECAFSYAIVRVVPDLVRGEFLNVGVLLFARQHNFLGLRSELDEQRLRALAPDFDPQVAAAALHGFAAVAAAEKTAGRIGELPVSERFGWLVAPSNTVVQCSAVHTGITTDPQRSLERLFTELVL